MTVKGHNFEDGEKVRIKQTREIVTVDKWWFAINFGNWSAQYNIVEYPSTWFFESELEKVGEQND